MGNGLGFEELAVQQNTLGSSLQQEEKRTSLEPYQAPQSSSVHQTSEEEEEKDESGRVKLNPYEPPTQEIGEPDFKELKKLSWWTPQVFDRIMLDDNTKAVQDEYYAASKELGEYNEAADQDDYLNVQHTQSIQDPNQTLLVEGYNEPNARNEYKDLQMQKNHDVLVERKKVAAQQWADDIWPDIIDGTDDINQISAFPRVPEDVKDILKQKAIDSGILKETGFLAQTFGADPLEEGTDMDYVQPNSRKDVENVAKTAFEKSKKDSDEIVSKLGIEVPEINKLFAELQLNYWDKENGDITEAEYDKKQLEIQGKLEEGYIKALESSGYNATTELNKDIYEKYVGLGLVRPIEVKEEGEEVVKMLESRKFLESDVIGKKLYIAAIYKGLGVSNDQISEKIDKLSDYITAPISTLMIRSAALNAQNKIGEVESKHGGFNHGLTKTMGGVGIGKAMPPIMPTEEYERLIKEQHEGTISKEGQDKLNKYSEGQRGLKKEYQEIAAFDRDEKAIVALNDILEEIIQTPSANQGTYLGNLLKGIYVDKGRSDSFYWRYHILNG